ncbi:MAG: hypothetical protein Q8Q23_04315 [bacterium]|nr:hypothetical protein [bacterium]
MGTKHATFVKIFAIIILLYAIFPTLGLIVTFLLPEKGQLTTGYVSTEVLLVRLSMIQSVVYAVVCGIGLLFRQKWALWLTAIPGIFFSATTFIDIVGLFHVYEVYAIVEKFILYGVWATGSVYLLKNRALF